MAKSMSLLWGAGSPPCRRVMIVLEEKKLQGCKHKLLSFEKGEHKSQEVLDINPRGQFRRGVPSFKHGDLVVNESYAACFYLESQFKSQGNKLVPDSPAEQALMYQRMFEGLTLYEKLKAVIGYTWFVPEEERHDSALKRNKEALATELRLWEVLLVTFFPTVATLFRFGLSAERYPQLGGYNALLKDRPSIKASWPPHWLENLKGQDNLKDI
uniref:GST N-terminal domain-containing protein n=1 Tax=Mola mola TaxID=94237 RepID=A0A3Q3XL24_MOLML